MDKIICNIDNLADLEVLESLAGDAGTAELARLGFNAVIPPVSSQTILGPPAEPADHLKNAQSLDELVSNPAVSSESLWDSLLSSNHSARPIRLHSPSQEREQVALMLQMSLPRLPIYDLDSRLVPGTTSHASRGGREYRELLRSLTFWRTKFRIGHANPRLVHADGSGLLIYIIDSWLITLNFNNEDVSVDVGTGGAMWLMLATGHDVHLHGSLLDLPSNSGAILANELAR